MMKRIIALLLILALSLSLASCELIDRVLGRDEITDDPGCVTHTDADDDGVCDDCSASVIVIVDLFAINDLHGKITAGNSQPGIAGLTTYLKLVSDENSVILSSGDMWQGSSESNLTHGALMNEWMGEIGVVAMTLGNHEYDWSDEYLYSNAALAQFPLLAINVYEKSTGERAEYATPSVVVSRGGIEIGIIGAIGDCYSSISGEVVGDVYFKVGDDLTELVKAESDRLKAEGVDVIIYSIHDGYGSDGTKYVTDRDIASYYDVELSDGYVDVVFEGHTHRSYVLTDSKGVYHLQGGGENKGLAHAVVRYNVANDNKSVTSPEIIKSGVYGDLEPDPLIDELLAKYKDQIDGAYDVLGTNSKYRDDSEVEQIVADLYYRYGVEMWGDEYDITLGGGFIRTRNPYNLKAGQVTYSDIYSLLPFDNELVLCSITGRDLKRKFINTSNSDYYIGYGDNDLSAIEDNRIYYVVVDTYTSSYAANRLTEVARYGSGTYARDLFAEYVKEGGLE